MKKQTFLVALSAASVFAGQACFAADGTINITGEIQGQTCVVSAGAGTTAANGGNFSVALEKVQASALAKPGDVAGSKPFSINIGAGPSGACANGTKAAILYESSSPMIDATTGNLKNTTGSTYASNVEVQILDGSKNNAPLNLASGARSAEVVVASNTATLPFQAQYIATGGAASAGLVETSVQYSVIYP